MVPNPVLLPQGVHAPLASETRERYAVITMGRLHRVKGHDMLIDAFSRIAKDFPKWDLWIHGDGRARKALTSQIHSLNLDDRIFLPGTTTEVGARLCEADLFVLPSRAEGFPNALAEAMGAGLPVVSFDCASGPSELIRDGVDGRLVPASDVATLSKTMAELMGSVAERRRLASRAPEVRDRFSPERILGLWEAVLSHLCARSRAVKAAEEPKSLLSRSNGGGLPARSMRSR